MWRRDWVRQTAVLVAVYIVGLFVLALWMPVWHDWDVKFYQRVSADHAPPLSSDITLVDDRSVDVPANRRTMLAVFLQRLASGSQHPTAVVLDYNFDPCLPLPCGEPLASTNAALIKALQTAARAGINVYATELVAVDHQDNVTGPLLPHDSQIYAHLTDAAHNNFNITSEHFAFYRACYAPANGLSTDVWSMALRVLPEFDRISKRGCNSDHQPVPGGASLPHITPAYSITNGVPFPKGAHFSKYVIVGTLAYDRPANSEVSGPELVARALNGELERAESNYYNTRPQDQKLLLLVPAFSGVTVLAFAACFFLGRRMPLPGIRPFLPWLSATLGLCIALGVFAAFEYLMLLSNQIQPQVTLASFGMVLAAALSGVRGQQFVREEMISRDVSTTEAYDYDVFVSYAHEETAWVYEHVYLPLQQAKLPDGRKLKVFFDRSSIYVGAAWQDRIALAIEGSRFIVPIYSDTYFTKNYCVFEIKRAIRKWIGAGSESGCILPIMRGHPKIPSTIDDVQGISIDDDPAVVDKIIAHIIEQLSRPLQ